MRRTTLIAAVIALLGVATVYAFQRPGVREKVEGALASALHPGKTVLVPQGTPVTVSLEDHLSTDASHAGDGFKATVIAPVEVDGYVAIPAGSEVRGHVIAAQAAGHISGHGRLQLYYDDVKVGSSRIPLDTRGEVLASGSNARRSATYIGGGALLGGLIGGVAGHSGGSAAGGALLGAAAGTGVSAASRRPEIVLTPGARLQFRLDHDLTVRAQAKQPA